LFQPEGGVVPSPLEERLKLSPYRKGQVLDDPARDSHVRELIGDELEGLSAGFKGYERPRGFALIGEDFTTTNGLLTPTFKLRRAAVLERYRPEIEALYSAS
jgi:long-chain acyl-CoA synthetase